MNRLAFAVRPWYGWVIVAVAALAMVATLPGRTHGLGMVTERLLADESFKMDRVTYSDINLWATLLGATFCLPCGYLIDRFGLRITLTLTVAALAGAVLWMTYLSGRWPLFVAILLTRGFGQSALSVISITMVGKWYQGRLSMPMAVYSLLLSMGFVAAAQWAKPFANADWRTVWGSMGWLLLGVMTPIAWFLTRDPPKSVDAASTAGDADPLETEGFTLRQALGTGAFWVFAFAISLVAIITSGQSLFNESVLKQQGFRAEAYYDLIALTGTVGLLTKLPVGWLARYYSLGGLQAVALLLMGACLFWLPHIHAQWQLTTYAAGMGLAGTMTTVLFFTVWGQAFGRAHLGEIQSVAQMMTVLASALGPKLLAECEARTGSYMLIFQALAGLLVTVAVASWLVWVPRPQDAPSAEATLEPIASAD
jgi:MFS family permease